MVKNLQAMRETRVRSLGWEDPVKEIATHSTPIFLPGESHRKIIFNLEFCTHQTNNHEGQQNRHFRH